MWKSVVSIAAFTVLASASAACGSGSDAAPGGSAASKSSSAPAGTGSAAAAAKSGGDMKVVDLAPLPLKLSMPGPDEAVTMDKTMDTRKSVGVSYDAISAGLNVSEPREKNFDEVKKSVKGDTVLFPFKKWVEESGTSAIAEVTAGEKTAYTAWAWKEVGGKPYVCQSAGVDGLKSVDDAKKVLAACDTLAVK